MVKNQTFTPTQPSFRNQLVMFTALGAVILSLVTSLLIAWWVTGMAKGYMTGNGQQVAAGLAEQSVLAVLTESGENAESSFEQVLRFPEVTAAKIILGSGRTLIEKGEFDVPLDQEQLNKVTKSQLFAEDEFSWTFAAPVLINLEGDDSSEFSFSEAPSKPKIMAYSIVKMTKNTLIKANQLILTYALVVGAIAVLIFTIVSNYGLSKLTQPLLNLAQVMLDAEKTSEHLRAEIEGPKEVQRMAHAYNSMMEVLDQQDEELRLHRDQLEAEVEIRTRELIEARDTALTANRHKSEFLANMTHELRTPIQAIIGYVDLVMEELEVEGLTDLQDDLIKVNNNSRRLLGLINSVLDFAKVEAGKMDVKPVAVNLNVIVTNVKETIKPLFDRNHNRLEFIVAENALILIVDQEKLEQILLNLLSNACKFTNKGTVTFATEVTEDAITFSVKDTGVGIEASHVERIFDEFQQVDGSQSRKFQGTGLGLAICKRFCELIDAEISVTSVFGEGSTFSVKLPLKSREEKKIEKVAVVG